MTIGISKERLEELCKKHSFINFLQEECTELNPWLPIDENTPKDRPCLFYYPTMPEGLRKRVTTRVCWDSALHKPTHYQELPGDPE